MSSELLNDDERFLYAHISDLAAISRKTGVPRFSRFLNERETAIALNAARTENANPLFFGGYDSASRNVCGFFDGTYAENLTTDEKYENAKNILTEFLSYVCAFDKEKTPENSLIREFIGR